MRDLNSNVSVVIENLLDSSHWNKDLKKVLEMSLRKEIFSFRDTNHKTR